MNLIDYLKPRTRYGISLYVIAVALLLPTIWLGWQAYGNIKRTWQWIERTETLRARQTQPAVVVAVDANEAKHWDALKAERAFPWTVVLLALERTTKADVELLGFQPDKLNRRITLSGEARDHKALGIYLDALIAQPALHNVYLSHQQTIIRDGLETVEFEIRAEL